MSSFSGLPPTLAELALLKWKDEKGNVCRFKLMNLVSNVWWKTGILLGLNPAELQNIEQQSSKNEQRLALVLTQWIDNDGHPPQYPLSWDGVYELLCDLDKNSAAEELRRAMDSHSL